MNISRRTFLKASALAATTPVMLGAVGKLPAAHALGAPIGTVIDYSAGIPDAREVKARGHLGAVRYVSNARPEAASWMKAKPVQESEAKALSDAGLEVASVYQFGRAETADWLQGAAGAAMHAPQAITLHGKAGGPIGRPIYIAIDDNPTREQYENQIRPYLRAFQEALQKAKLKTGVYGNYYVIDWAIADGIGEYFWMHDWGSHGLIHPRTTIHQKAKWRDVISGVEVDINNVYASDWGQWKPGYGPTLASDLLASIPSAEQLSSLIPAEVRSISLPNVLGKLSS